MGCSITFVLFVFRALRLAFGCASIIIINIRSFIAFISLLDS